MPDPRLPTELNGWKEVASYLRISVRTAQRLEREQGLPVQRGAGVKAPVFALAAELDAWKNRMKTGNLPAAPPKASLNDAADQPDSIGSKAEFAETRRRWLRYALGTSIPVVLAGAGAAVWKLRLAASAAPCSCQERGATLVALGPDSAEIWRHTFPAVINPTSIGCSFADLDGRGTKQALFVYAAQRDNLNARLVCFNSDGKVRWEFVPGKTVTDNLGRQFTPPFAAAAV